jgi:hypothetical protein
MTENQSYSLCHVKRKLTWIAAAIIVFGMLLLSFTNDHLISPVSPFFHNSVRAIFITSISWLMWRLYSDHGLWYIVSGCFVTPIAAIIVFISFDDVAAQLIILKEFSFGNYTVETKKYEVLRIGHSKKGRNHYAVISSLSSLDGRSSIAITKSQYNQHRDLEFQYTEHAKDKLCIRLITHTSSNGAVRVIGTDTKTFKKSLHPMCK